MNFHFPTTDIRKSDYDTLGYLCVMQNKPTSQKILFSHLASWRQLTRKFFTDMTMPIDAMRPNGKSFRNLT